MKKPIGKYYTPALEEFCIGLEFEHESDPLRGEWSKDIIETPDDLINVMKWYGGKDPDADIRIKHLDKKDIESLGFKVERKNEASNLVIINEFGSSIGVFYPEGPDYNIYIYNNCYALIDNKLDFKRFLTQMGISHGSTILSTTSDSK